MTGKVNSTMTYCNNFGDCHNVPQYTNNNTKNRLLVELVNLKKMQISQGLANLFSKCSDSKTCVWCLAISKSCCCSSKTDIKIKEWTCCIT